MLLQQLCHSLRTFNETFITIYVYTEFVIQKKSCYISPQPSEGLFHISPPLKEKKKEKKNKNKRALQDILNCTSNVHVSNKFSFLVIHPVKKITNTFYGFAQLYRFFRNKSNFDQKRVDWQVS